MAAGTWMPGGVAWPPAGLAGGLHTRLLGFVKTALLRQLVPPGSMVCDLFCGRGLDTERWAEAGIGRYIGVDLSASALEEAREQWEQHDRPFPADFCELDPCMVDLEAHLQNQGLPTDVVCCLAHLQDCFTSEDMVRRLLKNVATVLKPGGFFFGTAPDSSTIWYKYQKAVEGAMKAGSLRMNGTLPCVRTELYKISFDDDRFHAFGSKYHMRFSDDGISVQAQLLVHFPSLIRLAKEVGLECVEIQNLHEFYDDYSGPFADVLRSSCGSAVDSKGVAILDAKGRLNGQAVDVLSLYTTFIFKKGDPTMPNFRVSSTLEQVTRRSGSKHLTQLPSQNSEFFSYHRREERDRKGERVANAGEHVSLHSEITITSNLRDSDHLKVDRDPRDNGTAASDHLEDLSENGTDGGTCHDEEVVTEGMHEGSAGHDRHETANYPDREDQNHGSKPGLKKNQNSRPVRLQGQKGTGYGDSHAGGQGRPQLAGGELEFRTSQSKEILTSGAEEETHWAGSGRGLRTSGARPASSAIEDEKVEEPSPVQYSSKHHIHRTYERGDESKRREHNQDERSRNESSKSNWPVRFGIQQDVHSNSQASHGSRSFAAVSKKVTANSSGSLEDVSPMD